MNNEINYWYETDKNDKGAVARAVFGTVKALRDEQVNLRERFRRSYSLYLGYEASYLDEDAGLLDYNGLTNDGVQQTSPWNVSKSMVDALVSRLSLSQPVPSYQVTDASEETQYRAKAYQTFIKQKLTESLAYNRARLALRMASILGTSFIKVISTDQNKIVTRVLGPDRVVLDNRQTTFNSTSGLTSSVFHYDLVDESELVSLFSGDKKAYTAIKNAPVSSAVSGIRRFIEVVEAWYSTPDKKGRHIIAVNDDVLLDEEWKETTAPFAVLRYREALEGVYGEGLCQEIESIQEEIEFTLKEIANNLRYLGAAYIECDNKELLTGTDLLDSTRYKIIPTGSRITIPSFMNSEQVNYLNLQWNKAFEITGLNLLSVTAAKPAGLNSGEALRVYNHNQSARFTELQTNYSDLIIQISHLILSFGRAMSKGSDTEIGRALASDTKGDEFTLTVVPASSLPDDPAGRAEALQALMAAGLLTPEEGKSMLNMPDLKKILDLQSSPRDTIEYVIEKMIKDREYIKPEEMFNLQLAVELGLAYWNKQYRIGADHEVLGLLERFVQEASEMLAPPEPSPAPPAPPAPPPEMLAPAPPMPPEMMPPGPEALPVQ